MAACCGEASHGAACCCVALLWWIILWSCDGAAHFSVADGLQPVVVLLNLVQSVVMGGGLALATLIFRQIQIQAPDKLSIFHI